MKKESQPIYSLSQIRKTRDEHDFICRSANLFDQVEERLIKEYGITLNDIPNLLTQMGIKCESCYMKINSYNGIFREDPLDAITIEVKLPNGRRYIIKFIICGLGIYVKKGKTTWGAKILKHKPLKIEPATFFEYNTVLNAKVGFCLDSDQETCWIKVGKESIEKASHEPPFIVDPRKVG